ncbi:MAG: hypothetical protein WAN32_09525 [Candidatus Acidiferrum sp.]
MKQWIKSPPEWLEVRQITVPADLALARLDAGEREAIALAEALGADALLLDERAGRRETERRKIRVIVTVRILDDAAETDFVNLPECLQKLRDLGFYLDERLVEFLLQRHSARERRKSGT